MPADRGVNAKHEKVAGRQGPASNSTGQRDRVEDARSNELQIAAVDLITNGCSFIPSVRVLYDT
jgi:hypothetical protein